ncbi:MAG: IS1595 family transposase [Phycisphaerales bacterium]|jgi:transposase-like protein
MAKKRKKAGESDSWVLKNIPKACSDEKAAVEFMEKQRWGNTPACPRCGDTNVHQMKDSKGKRNKRFLWRCHGCKRQFTVRIKTVMEDSRIPLKVWCFAFWAACASKKGVSALQISRECGISYKSALFLMHRIRYAMSAPDAENKLRGIVEVDECYIGGKPRYSQRRKRGIGMKIGRGANKTAVLGMVSRSGAVRAKVVPNVTSKTLKSVMTENIDFSARLMTDEFPAYTRIGLPFKGHDVVNHGRKEYARGDITTNTVEAFFALIKRGVYGTYHCVSKKHLHRYLSEFEFRWATRDIDDGERVTKAIQNSEGKRLMYYEPASKSA